MPGAPENSDACGVAADCSAGVVWRLRMTPNNDAADIAGGGAPDPRPTPYGGSGGGSPVLGMALYANCAVGDVVIGLVA